MYTSILLTIAAAASFVAASPATPARRAVEAAQNNCTPGLYYCAGALLGKGNYGQQITQALVAYGLNDAVIWTALFYCEGGPNGDIRVADICNHNSYTHCADGGSGHSDFCQ